MAISNEIEKLERRWQQTSGLVFAPLAEAYRKAGLHSRALEILEQGLSLHPEYGPALIVRGRCHLDSGSLPEAEAAFEQALTRDPMDPIALRGIADVFARTGRVPDAIERLRTLVEIDPRNSEARLMLDRLMSEPPAHLVSSFAPAVPPPAPPIQPAAPEPAPPAAIAEPPVRTDPLTPALEPQPVSESFPADPVRFAPVEPQPTDDIPLEVMDLSSTESTPAQSEPPMPMIDADADDFRVESFAVEPLEVPPSPEPPAREEPLAPIEWTPAPQAVEPPVPSMSEPAATMADSVPAQAEPADPWLSFSPAPVEPEEPVQARQTAATELEPEPELTPESSPIPEPFSLHAVAESGGHEYPSAMPSIEPVMTGQEAFTDVIPEPLPAAVVDDEPFAAPVSDHKVANEEPTLIVTESMAELFLKQGHRELALAVYRQLAERDPASERLRDEIARLERELAPRPTPTSPPKDYAASSTGGRSVERMLQSVLQAQPPAAASSVLPPAIEPAGEPTRPSESSLPLSAVFGDEPVAAPKPEPSGPAPAEPSYDEFFGQVTSPEPAAAGGGERGAEAEDLRQFNEWLKGLKR